MYGDNKYDYHYISISSWPVLRWEFDQYNIMQGQCMDLKFSYIDNQRMQKPIINNISYKDYKFVDNFVENKEQIKS